MNHLLGNFDTVTFVLCVFKAIKFARGKKI